MNVVPEVIRRKLGLRRAVRRMFLGQDERPHEDGKLVLADLKKFCFADRSTATSGNSDLMMILEGRRQVYLRLIEKMKPDPDLLRALEMIEQVAEE